MNHICVCIYISNKKRMINQYWNATTPSPNLPSAPYSLTTSARARILKKLLELFRDRKIQT